MSEPRLLPAWAEELRRRYLRGEASLFILHGNVYDVVVHGQQTSSLVDFLSDVLLKESRETIAVYNVATGARFAKRDPAVANTDDLLLATQKDKALPALERLLVGSRRVAVILEYAETLAPAGDAAFQADADRAAIVTLHRWSSLPAIEKGDNIIVLVAENLSDLAPKIVSNPKVAVVEIPMPDRDTRRTVARIADPRLSDKDADRYAEITAGLKGVQIASILTPPPASEDEAAQRETFIAGILGPGPDVPVRAKKLAALTAGMPPDEIRRLIAPAAAAVPIEASARTSTG
jgi:transitional endoplasmic reticulum ATPase